MKLLTFNAALLEIRILGRTFFRPIEHIERRLSRMPEFLLKSDADVICLQEVYRNDHKQRFIDGLKAQYPYYTRDPKQYILGYDSGLMIFSRTPLVSEHVKRFTNQPIEERIFSKKIALAMTIQIDDLKIGVINCHATSIGFNFKQDDQRIERIRKQQINEVLVFSTTLKKKELCDLVFVTGDYNCGPQISEQNYQIFRENQYIDLFLRDTEELTWNPESNSLIQGATVYRDTPGQRVDLILSDTSVHQFYPFIETEILYKEELVYVGESGKFPLSDHYGVLTSLSRR